MNFLRRFGSFAVNVDRLWNCFIGTLLWFQKMFKKVWMIWDMEKSCKQRWNCSRQMSNVGADALIKKSYRPFKARMAASAVATECAAFEALVAAYLNGFAGVRGRCRAECPCEV
jgi:hypothetical protein